MLTRLYIEALLVDPETADQVWQAWDAREIDDLTACVAWQVIAGPNRLLTLPGHGQEKN